MNRGSQAFILVILLLSLIQGCGTGFAPVTDRSMGARPVATSESSQGSSRPAPLPNPGTYMVNRGDTLYSISWRYGLDYREVAKWNNVNERFQIFPGQVLQLTSPSSATGTRVASATISPVSSPSSQSQSSSQPDRSTTQQQTQTSSNQQPVSQQPSSQRPVSQQPTPQQQSRQQTSPQPAASPPQQPVVTSGQPVWRWPANGQIIRRFSAAEGGNKGIDIAGQLGDPVVAAADGRVVYAGSGLLGYGNLVIINHNREFLSAYAHNSRILVSENDMVKAGDKIAEMGQSGTDRVQLHFEIRRNGRPVDPLVHLPRR